MKQAVTALWCAVGLLLRVRCRQNPRSVRDEPDEDRAFALLLGDGGRRGGVRETHEGWSIALMHLTEPPEGVPRP